MSLQDAMSALLSDSLNITSVWQDWERMGQKTNPLERERELKKTQMSFTAKRNHFFSSMIV